jgi:hypothetical protein
MYKHNNRRQLISKQLAKDSQLLSERCFRGALLLNRQLPHFMIEPEDVVNILIPAQDIGQEPYM